ncbi:MULTISPECIES: sigma-70 family RNA polymerase sigma factor [unclassified Granulicatella]|uniref:sigma-70 family RNA polymerase sigma factor n=1 Tax=unclassified Granulicatella TaxID=2630493 RepID=UPI00107358DB|nr:MULTISPECIES: sigma-70 family RNA polymerase sigma factor [unclassified Granulicatella]MBF0780443.1 sigma-70 family RNA polymerase sigma factor [Granulicatella sp. 19428wC4_WM01]TFU95387.1 sigma-70 family RNA polymerase sigma factor [Granulicatella sp. WM01]
MENQKQDLCLIQKCREHNDEAFTTLALKYQPLMISKIKCYHFPLMDFDDLLQECRIILYQAVQRYKLDSRIKFSSFYMYLLKHHFCELIRYYNAHKRKGETLISTDRVHNDYIMENIYSDSLNPEQVVEVRERFECAYDVLSKSEKEVFYQNQINNPDFIQDKRVKRILYRAKYKIRKQMK